ncbi:short-chain dehydrogenase oxidoreductase [Diaporthe eres]|uniref:Short-chain dehydrogenase n=1 Tax=Diaporthe vaccinii TaxID=105482 RepID=A0ABR4E939_9PEZI|nr:short-chain dehydrogenase oxidoreductase [Diaporthe eres]
MPFPHKTVLITGATAGIGRALAERMAENGVFVIAVGRRKERLQELEAKYGRDKVVAEEFDMTKTAEIQAWAQRIIKQYPTLSSIILNAGIQRTLDFTNPSYDELSSKITSEVDTNYTSPLLTITAFLPHLISLGSSSTAASVILVTSGLALVPIARCANYCSTKSALHHFGLSLRSQMQSSPATRHVRVIDILPPAVQTELHELQPELVAAGQGQIGMPLKAFIDETWAALDRWDEDEDEIMVKEVKQRWGHIDNEKKAAFKQLDAMMRSTAGLKA